MSFIFVKGFSPTFYSFEDTAKHGGFLSKFFNNNFVTMATGNVIFFLSKLVCFVPSQVKN